MEVLPVLDWERPPRPIIASTCIHPRCRVCRLPFRPREWATGFWLENFEQIDSFPFPAKGKYEQYLVCPIDCEGDKSFGCHNECLWLSKPFNMDYPSLFKSTVYLYDPPADVQARRDGLLLSTVQRALINAYAELPCPPLPAELWEAIAKHLLPLYVTARAKTRLRTNALRTAKLSKSVWATYKVIDGVTYISGLSNRFTPRSRLLWSETQSSTQSSTESSAQSSTQKTLYYILEDHLGVRQIFRDVAPPQVPARDTTEGWWRVVPVESNCLKFQYDGLKFRSIVGTRKETPMSPLWPVPMPTEELDGMRYHLVSEPRDQRMIALDINAPEVFGYSICWNPELMYIHAHKHGEDLGFYRELDSQVPKLAWTFLPLNPGERVEEIWTRWSRIDYGDEIDASALALITDKGRRLYATSWPAGINVLPYTWARIARLPTERPSRAYFSYSVPGLHMLAIPSKKEDFEYLGQGRMPPSTPGFNSTASWFSSRCRLENVTEVTLCSPRDGKASRVTGLLLRCEDGSQRCIGKYRLDQAGPTLTREGSGLFIGMGYLRAGGKYVARVRVSRPDNLAGLEWWEHPWRGELRWCFKKGFEAYVGHEGELGESLGTSLSTLPAPAQNEARDPEAGLGY